MENRHFRMFIAMKIVSRVVRSPRLFLRIPTNPKTSAKANFEFQRHFKFFSRTSNPTFTFSREQLLGFQKQFSCKMSQKLLSWKHEGWIWSVRKNIEVSLEFKICFRRRLYFRGYPQKQTGWPYDAWNNFYRNKHAEVAIFHVLNLF